MEGLINASALSERINEMLRIANYEFDAIPLRGGTLANLAQLKHALTRVGTYLVINTIVDKLITLTTCQENY